jgi:predicted metal-dependent hydrolase
MPFDWDNGALAEGLRCYRRREFFETHEHWEAEWLRAAEPEKTFLQALIQIAAAFHHFERKNCIGAVSLLRGSLRKLDLYPAAFGGLDVESIRQNVRDWLSAFDADEQCPELPFPKIR